LKAQNIDWDRMFGPVMKRPLPRTPADRRKAATRGPRRETAWRVRGPPLWPQAAPEKELRKRSLSTDLAGFSRAPRDRIDTN
jgi:hypothetical protein